jgi:hypothetical protein
MNLIPVMWDYDSDDIKYSAGINAIPDGTLPGLNVI